MAELKHKLLVTVEKGLCFGHYPAPFLLVGWHHSVGRLQPLVVQFGLLVVTSSYKYQALFLTVTMNLLLT